jgi:two-component system cell cycle sensor histidine kinase/response regulator CckA
MGQPDKMGATASLGAETQQNHDQGGTLDYADPRCQSMLDRLPIGCMLLASAPPARCLFVNKAFVRITGYSPDDIPTYKAWIEKAYPDAHYREQVTAFWGEEDSCKSGTRTVRRIVCKNGEECAIQMCAQQMGVDAVLLTIVDVGCSRDRDQALRDSEQKYSNLFHQSHDAIIVHDLSGNILDVNQSALDLFGYQMDQLLALKISVLHSTDQVDIARKAFQAVQSDGHARFEIRFLRRDGSSFPAEVSSSLFEASGRRLVQGIVRDMTERIASDSYRRGIENRLRHMQKMEAVGELAGGVAHDFNNMLTVIMGNCELLEMSMKGSPDCELVKQVLTAGRRAAELTGQLLAFARRGGFSPHVVDLHDTIRDVHALLLHGIDRKIEIEMDLCSEVPLVMADPAFLQTALLNLGINARDAMRDGGTITYRTCNVELLEKTTLATGFELAPGRYVEIAVSDTGCGISPELHERIFEPFFTTKEVGKGTGMGLAAVYGCAKRHGGSIEITSGSPSGSVFTLRLPETTDSDHVIDSPPVREFMTGQGHVLVVDDEEMVRNFAATAIRSLGYAVTTAVDGCDAVEFYAQNWTNIDLVVLDLVMPNMNGEEAFAAFKRVNPDVRALVATGYTEQAVYDRLGEQGISGFVSKPFRIDDLARKIHAHVSEQMV